MANITWGYIGLGNIGYPMAINIRKKMPVSHKLIVMDLNKVAVNKFFEDVASLAKSGDSANSMLVETSDNAKGVAAKCSVLITCLPSSKAVEAVFNSIVEDGELPPLQQERLFIDLSTIDPHTSQKVAKVVHDSKIGRYVDAPVSGGVAGARAGTLSLMFGAPRIDTLLEQIRSILFLVGDKVWHMGEQSAGVRSKIANNYILCINNIATAEAMNMARQWGLDAKALTDMLKVSTGRCWPVEVNNPVPGVIKDAPASKNYEPGGTVAIIKKDLGLAIADAKASNAALRLADVAWEVYDAVEKEHHGKDFSIVYQWLQTQ
ncbi:3-hydroxyisobutyrate dehydrogenase, partial [Penicillium sp. IBT 18751x]